MYALGNIPTQPIRRTSLNDYNKGKLLQQKSSFSSFPQCDIEKVPTNSDKKIEDIASLIKKYSFSGIPHLILEGLLSLTQPLSQDLDEVNFTKELNDLVKSNKSTSNNALAVEPFLSNNDVLFFMLYLFALTHDSYSSVMKITEDQYQGWLCRLAKVVNKVDGFLNKIRKDLVDFQKDEYKNVLRLTQLPTSDLFFQTSFQIELDKNYVHSPESLHFKFHEQKLNDETFKLELEKAQKRRELKAKAQQKIATNPPQDTYDWEKECTYTLSWEDFATSFLLPISIKFENSNNILKFNWVACKLYFYMSRYLEDKNQNDNLTREIQICSLSFARYILNKELILQEFKPIEIPYSETPENYKIINTLGPEYLNYHWRPLAKEIVENNFEDITLSDFKKIILYVCGTIKTTVEKGYIQNLKDFLKVWASLIGTLEWWGERDISNLLFPFFEYRISEIGGEEILEPLRCSLLQAIHARPPTFLSNLVAGGRLGPLWGENRPESMLLLERQLAIDEFNEDIGKYSDKCDEDVEYRRNLDWTVWKGEDAYNLYTKLYLSQHMYPNYLKSVKFDEPKLSKAKDPRIINDIFFIRNVMDKFIPFYLDVLYGLKETDSEFKAKAFEVKQRNRILVYQKNGKTFVMVAAQRVWVLQPEEGLAHLNFTDKVRREMHNPHSTIVSLYEYKDNGAEYNFYRESFLSPDYVKYYAPIFFQHYLTQHCDLNYKDVYGYYGVKPPTFRPPSFYFYNYLINLEGIIPPHWKERAQTTLKKIFYYGTQGLLMSTRNQFIDPRDSGEIFFAHYYYIPYCQEHLMNKVDYFTKKIVEEFCTIKGSSNTLTLIKLLSVAYTAGRLSSSSYLGHAEKTVNESNIFFQELSYQLFNCLVQKVKEKFCWHEFQPHLPLLREVRDEIITYEFKYPKPIEVQDKNDPTQIELRDSGWHRRDDKFILDLKAKYSHVSIINSNCINLTMDKIENDPYFGNILKSHYYQNSPELPKENCAVL